VFAAPVCPSILTGTVRGTDSGGTDWWDSDLVGDCWDTDTGGSVCWDNDSGGSDCSYSEIVIQKGAIAGIMIQRERLLG